MAAVAGKAYLRGAMTIGHRPCTICAHPNRAEVEAAVRRGAPLRLIARQHGISARSLGRHREKHPELPVVPRAPPSRSPILDSVGNILIGALGQVLTAPPVPAPPRDFRHEMRWWTPTEPGPQLGDRCAGCGGKDWWRIPGSHGGCCTCWGGAQFYGGHKSTFTT